MNAMKPRGKQKREVYPAHVRNGVVVLDDPNALPDGTLVEVIILPPFDEVWRRIVQHAGEPFKTKRGREFTYTVTGNHLKPDHVNRNIGQADFEKALKEVPLSGPGVIRDVCQGPAFVYAILMDDRIRHIDW